MMRCRPHFMSSKNVKDEPETWKTGLGNWIETGTKAITLFQSTGLGHAERSGVGQGGLERL